MDKNEILKSLEDDKPPQMTTEQATAYINSQTALYMGRLNEMVADNRQRYVAGESPAYTGADFGELVAMFEPTIGKKAVFELYRACSSIVKLG